MVHLADKVVRPLTQLRRLCGNALLLTASLLHKHLLEQTLVQFTVLNQLLATLKWIKVTWPMLIKAMEPFTKWALSDIHSSGNLWYCLTL